MQSEIAIWRGNILMLRTGHGNVHAIETEKADLMLRVYNIYLGYQDAN